MKVVTVRKTQIGAGTPKICVPVMGRNRSEVLQQTQQAAAQSPDLLEWRADFYENLSDMQEIECLTQKMRCCLGEIPLIFTFRTKPEGGNREIQTQEYQTLLQAAARIPQIDILDVEIFRDASMEKWIPKLQAEGKIVIASNHHFQNTPSIQQMQEILNRMQNTGADLRKLAVMPKTPEDVLTLLAVTLWANRTGDRPVITMSMGQLGVLSRVSGEMFGSCVTFGTVGSASALGQMELSDLRKFLAKFKL